MISTLALMRFGLCGILVWILWSNLAIDRHNSVGHSHRQFGTTINSIRNFLPTWDIRPRIPHCKWVQFGWLDCNQTVTNRIWSMRLVNMPEYTALLCGIDLNVATFGFDIGFYCGESTIPEPFRFNAFALGLILLVHCVIVGISNPKYQNPWPHKLSLLWIFTQNQVIWAHIFCCSAIITI